MNIVEINESLQPLRDVFNRRYAEWALQDTLDQCQRGFVLLQRVKSSDARCVLRHVDSLAPSEREQLLRAAWKQMNANFERKDAQLTVDDLRLLEELRTALLNRWSTPTVEEEVGESIIKSRALLKLNKGILRKEINKYLIRVLGNTVERWGPQEWRFTTNVGAWNVYTFFDVGGKSQLKYEHKIGLRENVYLREHIDLQAWMGLGHTWWDEIRSPEISKAAQGLAEICQHFLLAVPSLLKGLTPLHT